MLSMLMAEHQLRFEADWTPRECQSAHHQGSRILPADRFVRNGLYRRTVCRECWAARQREHETINRQADSEREGLERMLNTLWRPLA